MDVEKVLSRLNAAYPNKKIISLPTLGPTEILCEVEPASEHSEYSVAISIIDKSVSHYHIKSIETYKILEGELDLYINGLVHHMKKGDSMVINPFSHHYAIGNETWIECRSEPGWTIEDHIT
jgi:mannose-6-phosphate isomerase-like protein (cupin superfamily)